MDMHFHFPPSYAIKTALLALLFTIALLIWVYAQGGVSRAIYPQP